MVPASDVAALLTHTDACRSHSEVPAYTTELSREQTGTSLFQGYLGIVWGCLFLLRLNCGWKHTGKFALAGSKRERKGLKMQQMNFL